MNHPIVIAAFGTTSRARTVYDRVDERLRRLFPDHEIHWAYSSRIVRHKLKKRGVHAPTPLDVLEKIAEQGGEWAVVQSFNMICGHEFYRLGQSVLKGPPRVSIGHSLLCGPGDFSAVAEALAPYFAVDSKEAVALVGHGTDHCAWSVYPALEAVLRRRYGARAFVGVIEGDRPTRDAVIHDVQSAGFERVRLAPLMLVAGIHFEEDLVGPDDSWKSAFEAKGVEVAVEKEGLGGLPGIIDIFCGHIESALNVIPLAVESAGKVQKKKEA